MLPLLRKILDATRLTRQGRIAEATAAIRDAVSPATRARAHKAGDRDDVVEVEAVEVPERSASDVQPGEIAVTGDGAALATAEGRPTATERMDFTETAPSWVDAAGQGDRDAAVAEGSPQARAEPDEGRFVESSFTAGAGTRAFKLFVPGGRAGDALPLVVMLHGCTQDPDDFAAGTRMNSIAQEQGFLVLYPAQTQRANAHRCWNWFSPRHQHRGAGEPALLAAMTREIVRTHGVDRDRVYVAGLSAGGAMAAILAREYPDVFAAAGVHSGVVPGVARDVASALAVMRSGPGHAAQRRATDAASRPPKLRPAPLIVFHGDADTTVAIANADAVLSTAIAGAAVVATTTQGTAASSERAFRRTVWRRADDGAAPSVAEHWVVHGSAHAWSGGDTSGSYTDPFGPDASREMLRFFAEHPRAARATETFAEHGETEGAAP